MCNAQLRNLDNISASTLPAQPVSKAAEPEEAPAAEEPVYEDASSDLDLSDVADAEIDSTQAFTL